TERLHVGNIRFVELGYVGNEQPVLVHGLGRQFANARQVDDFDFAELAVINVRLRRYTRATCADPGLHLADSGLDIIVDVFGQHAVLASRPRHTAQIDTKFTRVFAHARRSMGLGKGRLVHRSQLTAGWRLARA